MLTALQFQINNSDQLFIQSLDLINCRYLPDTSCRTQRGQNWRAVKVQGPPLCSLGLHYSSSHLQTSLSTLLDWHPGEGSVTVLGVGIQLILEILSRGAVFDGFVC